MTKKTIDITSMTDREIVLSRVFDAPRILVFEAHSKPEHIARWWGPKRFTLQIYEMDFRPGGAWRFVQRGPDGMEYGFRGVYREIVPPERLVYTFEFEGMPGHVAIETVTFAEQDGRTKLTSTVVFESAADRDAMLQSGMEEGAAETWDRLAQHLRTMATPEREIVISRDFDAPRELVWEAWTDPEHVAQWWGPKGFTTTIETMDVRPGGVWKHVMHGPDGTDYPNRSVFIEVVKPERIVYSHGGGTKGRRGVRFEATWTFEALDRGTTRLTIRQVFPSAEDRDRVVKEYGAIEGGKQTLERLGEHLRAVTATAPAAESGHDFVITRVFDAPRELVFKAWTESERLKEWWGPKGFAMLTLKLDLRPGGIFHYCMRAPNGSEMWGKLVYREIVAPERVVFVNSFSDENGGLTRHPLSPSWPREVLNTLTLTEHEGQTTLKLRGGPINATEEERKTFEAGHKSIQQGVTGTFDQLAAYLAKARRDAS